MLKFYFHSSLFHFRFSIFDFRFSIFDFPFRPRLSDFKFAISNFKFQISADRVAPRTIPIYKKTHELFPAVGVCLKNPYARQAPTALVPTTVGTTATTTSAFKIIARRICAHPPPVKADLTTIFVAADIRRLKLPLNQNWVAAEVTRL
jgi:hypothetical protein